MENVKKMDFEGDVSIYHDGNGALFKSEEYEVYTRIIQGEYFKYKKMFMSGEMFTIIDRRVLMEAINRARLCGSAEDKAPVIMDNERRHHWTYIQKHHGRLSRGDSGNRTI